MNGECVMELATQQTHKDSIIVMTRVPYPGATKTRMMPELTPDECAELHAAFLNDLKIILDVLSVKGIEIYFAIAPEHKDTPYLDKIPDIGTHFYQEGRTLGERMRHAFMTVFEGHTRSEDKQQIERRVILIGSDIPQVGEEDLKLALNSLEGHDAVIAPTCDGGYWLIGMNEVHDFLFVETHMWGGSSVFESTMSSMAGNGLTFAVGKRYQDIDTVEDINSLYESTDSINLLNNTQKWCSKHFDKTLTKANG